MTSPLSENPFYHSTVKKIISSFGEIFSGIRIVKKDSLGNKDQIIEVPVQYAPKNKWLAFLNEDPNKTKNVEFVLPRMAFEITGYQYDASRKIGTLGQNVLGSIGNKRARLYNPVPYDINISLYSLCKTQEDSLQILEQILPYFGPSMTVSIETLPIFNIKNDIPIVLESVEVEDSYQGLATDYRLVQQTFKFVAQVDLFGPIISSSNVIKHTNVGLSTTVTTSESGRKLRQDVVPESANVNETYVVQENWGFE